MDINYKAQLLAAGVELDSALERFMNNEDIYERFLGIFLEDSNFDELKLNINNKNYEAAFNNAHTLKGVSANLGLQSVCTALQPLVDNLRIGDYTNIHNEFLSVEEGYNEVCDVIKSNFSTELIAKYV